MLGISGVKRVAVEKTGLLSHRAFRGLVSVLLMSLMGTFPESAPWGASLDADIQLFQSTLDHSIIHLTHSTFHVFVKSYPFAHVVFDKRGQLMKTREVG